MNLNAVDYLGQMRIKNPFPQGSLWRFLFPVTRRREKLLFEIEINKGKFEGKKSTGVERWKILDFSTS